MRFLFMLLMLSCSTPATASASFSARDINGTIINTDDYLGKVVMLNFWATWCGPCLAEMPHLQKIQDKYKDDLVLISINVDEARNKSKVKPLIKSRGYTFIVVYDSSRTLTAALNPQMTLPYNIIIGTDGNIVWQEAGYHPGKEEAIKKILDSIIK